MKKCSTLFLKLAVFVIGIPVLILCILMLPIIFRNIQEGLARWDYLMLGIFLIMYLAAIPFYMTLYQAFRLLKFIDSNRAFSSHSVAALKKIKLHALSISGIYTQSAALLFICRTR